MFRKFKRRYIFRKQLSKDLGLEYYVSVKDGFLGKNLMWIKVLRYDPAKNDKLKIVHIADGRSTVKEIAEEVRKAWDNRYSMDEDEFSSDGTLKKIGLMR